MPSYRAETEDIEDIPDYEKVMEEAMKKHPYPPRGTSGFDMDSWRVAQLVITDRQQLARLEVENTDLFDEVQELKQSLKEWKTKAFNAWIDVLLMADEEVILALKDEKPELVKKLCDHLKGWKK